MHRFCQFCSKLRKNQKNPLKLLKSCLALLKITEQRFQLFQPAVDNIVQRQPLLLWQILSARQWKLATVQPIRDHFQDTSGAFRHRTISAKSRTNVPSQVRDVLWREERALKKFKLKYFLSSSFDGQM